MDLVTVLRAAGQPGESASLRFAPGPFPGPDPCVLGADLATRSNAERQLAAFEENDYVSCLQRVH